MRDFLPDPRRLIDKLVRVVEFHFSDDKALVFTLELVHHPDDAIMQDFEAGLLNQGPVTKVLQHYLRVVDRDLILELAPSDAIVFALNRKVSTLLRAAHPDSHPMTPREIALAKLSPNATSPPLILQDEEFALDLYRHWSHPPAVGGGLRC